MNITTVFSKLGDNSSLVPTIIKDSIDNTGRVVMAYKEGAKEDKRYGRHEARERFIEENTTSLVWLGGIPALKLLSNKVINKVFGFKHIEKLGKDAQANTNLLLLKKDSVQSLSKNIKAIKDKNITSTTVQEIVDQADIILKNANSFKKWQIGKFAFATIIPFILIGLKLQEFNQGLTEKLYTKESTDLQNQKQNKPVHNHYKQYSSPVFSSFIKPLGEKQKPSFKGGLGDIAINVFNNPLTNMAILDGSIAIGRMATSRNKAERIEKGIKEAGVIFFIYKGGKSIATMFNKLSEKVFKTPIKLDSKILEDKDFVKYLKSKTLEEISEFTDLSKFNLSKNQPKTQLKNQKKAVEKTILDFVDDNIANGLENGNFKNITLKAAQKLGLVDVIDGVRNPLKYVNTKEIKDLNKDIVDFAQKAIKSGDVDKFVKKAVNLKRASIIANIALCSISTAYLVPKIQYFFREKYTKTAAAPGLKEYDNKLENNLAKA